MVVLAQNQSLFDPKESFAYFNFENPPRRDVVLLPEQGYIAIAMRADNPGAWLIHCHIAWHSSGGECPPLFFSLPPPPYQDSSKSNR